MKLLILMLAFLTFKTWAISEDNYAENYKLNVLPFVKSMSEGYFSSAGLKLHYRLSVDPENTKCVVILPGRSEAAEKYGEFVYDLKQTDFGKSLNYFVLDHRGQGSSDRMTDKMDMGYVDHFSNYVTDVGNFLTVIVGKYNCEKKYLFAHSMGAGIGLRYVELHPDVFDALAISSPMLKIQTKPYPYLVARSIVMSMIAIGKGDEFAIGQNGYSSERNFEKNKYTTSKVRYEMSEDIFEIFPKTKFGGVSNKWLLEVMNGTIALRKNYSKLTAPMKLFRAGTELYSDPAEMHKMCVHALKCEEHLYPNSKHEVYNDQDPTRNDVIANVIDLFSNN